MNKLDREILKEMIFLPFLSFFYALNFKIIQKKLFANGKNMCILAIAIYFQYFFEFSKQYERFYVQKSLKNCIFLPKK